ncbi:uncharacterized protein [Phyllobates terribilis]|uniref:uncharacterized protein n=1 Tax=Phyllobates terribilis TaxID=111132 RepID=UPI003CCAC888
MDMDGDKMAERILYLTLEILFRLTGEDYTVVKKTSIERCQDPVSEGWVRPLSPNIGPPSHPLMHENINRQKILELTYKMIELLTGEVPIRCQDVAVYFSMEEWEYLEGHKDLYRDFMMEVPQPLTSPDLSSKRTTPERCPRPLLPQDCKQEDPNVPQDHQGEDLTHINTTETYVRGDERCKEEIPTYDHPEIEQYIQRLETTYKTEICPLASILSHLTDKVQRLEDNVVQVVDHQNARKQTLDSHSQQIIISLFNMVDDQENHNNIRIRSIPENLNTQAIMPTLWTLFHNILGDPIDKEVEINRAHPAGPEKWNIVYFERPKRHETIL